MHFGGGSDLRFLVCAVFTDQRSPIEVGEACFANIERAPVTVERGVTVKTLFPPEYFGNQKIEWWGELWLEPGKEMASVRYKEAEQILYVLEGQGVLYLWDKEITLRPGSIAYIVARATHAIVNTGNGRLRLVGSRSQIGRMPMPAYYLSLSK